MLFLSFNSPDFIASALHDRRVIEEARDSGLNLAFFSGNEVFWRIRYVELYWERIGPVYNNSNHIFLRLLEIISGAKSSEKSHFQHYA